MEQKPIRLIPLGGLGSVGKNCTVLEYDGDILVIDAGIQFPDDDMPGVDLVLPDFSYLVEHRKQVRGIVITHGHEDHIGGLPYLLEDVRAPIYATPLTLGLIEAKLNARQRRAAPLRIMRLGEAVTLGPFRISPFHVNHSIPDAVGLAIRTPQGLIVHSGDFKIDHTPLEGQTTDLSTLAQLASEGVIMLLSDSTNAESAGYTPSESQLRDAFHRVFMRAKGRIIVATFASLLARIQLVLETAERFGRKVAIAGRSMEENIDIAEALGYVRFPSNARVTLDQIRGLPDDQVVILATGSQGEPNSALARMAMGRFRQVKIKAGDTVVFSSNAIPGNEAQIYHSIDNLFRRGAHVVYGRESGLHVSGHAAQEELKLMLNLLRPLYFVPIHGAYRMLYSHAQLAYQLGFSQDEIFILENGDCLELTAQSARLAEHIPAGDVLVDGSLVGDVGQTILRDRMALARDGFVVAKVAVSPKGRILATPEIISQGFVYMPESTELMRLAQEKIVETIKRHAAQCEHPEELTYHIKRRLGSFFYNETRRRPVIIAMVNVV